MPATLPVPPSKVIAVHLNYRSRAAQRGRMPEFPSYFLKPPSSLCGTGDEVIRPAGCELLAFEGEIALVIGERTRGVSPADGWGRVRWVTAANDLGVYDLRYADRGSNLRSKGADGFTPVGPELLDAHGLDPAALRVRTWVNGELAQADTTGNLLFSFGHLVADLSRLMTLEPGDLILTGTPAGASVLHPGDVVEVEVDGGGRSTGRLRNEVAAADGELPGFGAMPRADEQAAADAYGRRPPARAGVLTGDLRATLRTVATATLASQLRSRGLQGVTIDGVHPVRPGTRLAGVARTLRYVPLREDLFDAYGKGMNAQKRAIEQIGQGEVLVMEARGTRDAGTIGDILALRAQVRGAAGIVTDGAVRDSAALRGLDIPVFCAAAHPSVLGRRHVPWETDTVIACGGATVAPGDLLVGDDDGIVVLPAGIAAEVAAAAAEQERQEAFIAQQVKAGEPIEGLYPLGEAWRPAYQRWLAKEQG
ncbi:MAG TPA: fumarylacetoacetate hydrolase family protein [Streptosporangiaceae bacterium]|nr:fumarylacetoacetate hydrolase family protein [Streptosporangiaceae bacterium]